MTLKIVVDAGHGINTPGKRTPDDSMREFTFNSVVTKYLRKKLEEYEGVSVKFSHDETGVRDISLTSRAEVANTWSADLLISIHANAYGSNWNDANGLETFAPTSYTPAELKLADAIQKNMVNVTGLRDRGVKHADFTVIYRTKTTAVLVEAGFMTNAKEAALLKSESYRNKIADAIVKAVADVYLLKRKEDAKLAKDYVEVSVRVNGKDIGEVGELKAGVTRVPVRKIAEALGATVTYDSKTKTVDIKTKATP